MVKPILMPFLIVAASTAGNAVQLEAVGDEPMVDSPLRSISTISREVRSALRNEACSRRIGDNTAEILQLVRLSEELARDPRSVSSVTLQKLGGRLRIRLRIVHDHVLRQIGNDGTSKHKTEADAVRAMKSGSANPSNEIELPASPVLAQQIAPAGQVRAVGTTQGIPRDYGPELARLIQRTISPATWNVNGGQGAVVYYAPLRVLVVRAPADVHDQIGGVLGAARGM
jgi:hypothetical protein